MGVKNALRLFYTPVEIRLFGENTSALALCSPKID